MKLKAVLLIFVGSLCIFAVSQIFMIYPSAGEIYPLYKSGYFSELDRQFRTIADAYRLVMLYGREEYGRGFLREVGEREGIEIHLFDERGEPVNQYGKNIPDEDKTAIRITQSIRPEPVSEIRGNRYYGAIPLFFDVRDQIRHQRKKAGTLAGVITFERPYDAGVYFSGERKTIFTGLALACAFLFFIVLRWDPERPLKELFDK
jgi:hypothetical protein